MVPVQRKSRSQSRQGRSHLFLRASQAVRCPNCGSPKHPHTACRECGYVRPGLKLDFDKDN